MAEKHHEQNLAKRYLLRQLSESEQQEIEWRFVSNDDFSEELETVEDELIDEYLADELSPDDRVSFEQDFLTTPERTSKLNSSQAMKRYFDRNTAHPLAQPNWLERLLKWLGTPLFPSGSSVAILSSPASVAIGVLVFAGLGLFIWRSIPQSDLEQGLLALNEAYRQERPVEARISTLDYAPFEAKRGNKSERVNNLELDRAQRFLLDAEKERADAASHHALAKLYLLQRQYDKAIEYLEKAAKANPKDAQIYADFGAAYLEKGKLELDAGSPNGPEGGKGLEDLGRSLEYLKQALELDPSLLEALFNRALVHDAQHLETETEADWRAYLAKDSSSQWATEAQENLKNLEDKKTRGSQNGDDKHDAFMLAYHARDDTTAWEIYRRSHTPAGNSLTKDLIDGFLAHKTDVESHEKLQVLNYLGQLETRRTEDAYTADLAKVYALATPQTQALLVQARQQVADGRELFNQSKIDDATELFVSARKIFEEVGDLPESLAADAAITRGAAVQPDLRRGQEVLARIVPVCKSKRYKWLLAQLLTDRAQILSNLDKYSEAITDGSDALKMFQELQDLSGTLRSFSQLANLHLFLNDTETSFSFLKQAMSIAQKNDAAPNEEWPLFIAASLNLSALQLYRAAFDYQTEALHLAFLSKRPRLISRSYQYLGLTYGSLRQFDRAIESVRRAYEQGKPQAAERDGQNMMASASLRLGDLYRVTGDENNALAAYEESSQLYEKLNFAHYNYAAHKGKFLSYLAQNNDARAWQELQIVLQLFDDYREKILGERQSNFFFDREQETYDLAIDFAYSRMGDERRAFDYSERCRARNLHELRKHGAEVTPGANGLDVRSSKAAESETALALTAFEIQQQLPEKVQLVQYAVLEKKLLVWRITRTEFFSKVVEVDSHTLEEMVATTLNQIKQRDENGAANGLKALHHLLIEPISEKLDSNMVICFVPDKKINWVPFGALMSRSSGRYLVQDYRIMSSPSSTILIDSTNKASDLASIHEERLLAVGNPSFDRSLDPNLSNLRGAEREVEEIARDYAWKRVLIGPEATRKSVKDELARSQVAHFAGHYQIDTKSQLASKLLLAPEPGDRSHAQLSGLDSRDIYQTDLAHTKLVVLSACQTGIEQQLRGEGPIGFARSFLVAGVPVVVASLWPVDSKATSELMIRFHRVRKQKNFSTIEALTLAQQDMATHGTYRDPHYWAGFIVIGGYSEF